MTAWKQQVGNLFGEHKHQVEKMVFRLVRDRDASADIVQDVFSALLAKDGYQLEDGTKILYKAARNQCFNYLNGCARRTSIRALLTAEQLIFESPSALDVLRGKEALRKLGSALVELPVRSREIFTRRHLGNETNAEIARDLGVSIRAVEKHLVMATDHCKRALADDLY